MAVITDLPCEVIATILRNLGNIPSLLASLLTCRYIYTSFQENPSLGADILQQQIGPDLLPFAVAALEALHLNLHADATVHELLEALYTEPSRLTALLHTMPVPFLGRIGHLHEVIQDLTVNFASNGLAHLANEPPSASVPPPLSPAEHFRFCRAFYRAELYFRLFRRESGLSDLSVTENEKEWFFSRHPPWENEQLNCAYDFLELIFAKASHDVLAHDVFFGELGIDYCTSGENFTRQRWISQGVCYVNRLANEPSWHAKRDMLESKFLAGMSDLYSALVELFDETGDDSVPLADYTDEELLHTFPTPQGRALDKGPFSAWRLAFKDMHKAAWAMMKQNSWLRERAYVLWDAERLGQLGVLAAIEDAPEDGELQEMERGHDSMWESFRERSEIWQAGGWGRWSKGDLSGIVWPEEGGPELLGK